MHNRTGLRRALSPLKSTRRSLGAIASLAIGIFLLRFSISIVRTASLTRSAAGRFAGSTKAPNSLTNGFSETRQRTIGKDFPGPEVVRFEETKIYHIQT